MKTEQPVYKNGCSLYVLCGEEKREVPILWTGSVNGMLSKVRKIYYREEEKALIEGWDFPTFRIQDIEADRTDVFDYDEIRRKINILYTGCPLYKRS